MVRTVIQRNFKVYYGISRENTRIESALDTLVYRGDKFLRNRAADNVVAELVSFTGLVGLYADLYVTVLTRTARLTLILQRLR